MWFWADLLDVFIQGWRYRHSDDPKERAQAARSMGCSLAVVITILVIAAIVAFNWVAHRLATDGM